MPVINKPTRITYHTATLIDNIFTNNINNIKNSKNGVIFSDISDHLPIVHVSDIDIFEKNRCKYGKNTENTLIIQRVYNMANVSAFKDAIKKVSWNEVYWNTYNTEHAFDQFMKLFMDTYNKHFPH